MNFNSEIQHKVFNYIKSSFSDFHWFDQIVAEKLQKAINDANDTEINMKTTKKVTERYFSVDSFKSADQKSILKHLDLIFKATYVLLYSNLEHLQYLKWNSKNDLFESYPQFAGLDEEEIQLLLNFRNMLRITLLLIPARLNKLLIIKIAGRLEGSQNEYITGGGQKKEVQRRVLIFEQESGVYPEKRKKRSNASLDNNNDNELSDYSIHSLNSSLTKQQRKGLEHQNSDRSINTLYDLITTTSTTTTACPSYNMFMLTRDSNNLSTCSTTTFDSITNDVNELLLEDDHLIDNMLNDYNQQNFNTYSPLQNITINPHNQMNNNINNTNTPTTLSPSQTVVPEQLQPLQQQQQQQQQQQSQSPSPSSKSLNYSIFNAFSDEYDDNDIPIVNYAMANIPEIPSPNRRDLSSKSFEFESFLNEFENDFLRSHDWGFLG